MSDWRDLETPRIANLKRELAQAAARIEELEGANLRQARSMTETLERAERSEAELAIIEASTIGPVSEKLQTMRLQKLPGTEGCHALMQAEEAIRALANPTKG